MLYCTKCNRVATPTAAICGFCNVGFTARLACGTCGKEVPVGQSWCLTCDQAPTDLVPSVILPSLPSLSSAISPSAIPPKVPGLPLGMRIPEPVPESYIQRRFGVEAEVTLYGRDAEILTRMQQVAALLHVLAGDMNAFGGVMESTRKCIRSCRQLAGDLQEEVEVRRGPQG